MICTSSTICRSAGSIQLPYWIISTTPDCATAYVYLEHCISIKGIAFDRAVADRFMRQYDPLLNPHHPLWNNLVTMSRRGKHRLRAMCMFERTRVEKFIANLEQAYRERIELEALSRGHVRIQWPGMTYL